MIGIKSKSIKPYKTLQRNVNQIDFSCHVTCRSTSLAHPYFPVGFLSLSFCSFSTLFCTPQRTILYNSETHTHTEWEGRERLTWEAGQTSNNYSFPWLQITWIIPIRPKKKKTNRKSKDPATFTQQFKAENEFQEFKKRSTKWWWRPSFGLPSSHSQPPPVLAAGGGMKSLNVAHRERARMG